MSVCRRNDRIRHGFGPAAGHATAGGAQGIQVHAIAATGGVAGVKTAIDVNATIAEDAGQKIRHFITGEPPAPGIVTAGIGGPHPQATGAGIHHLLRQAIHAFPQETLAAAHVVAAQLHDNDVWAELAGQALEHRRGVGSPSAPAVAAAGGLLGPELATLYEPAASGIAREPMFGRRAAAGDAQHGPPRATLGEAMVQRMAEGADGLGIADVEHTAHWRWGEWR